MKNFFWTLLVPLLAFCACNGFNPITDGEIVDIIGEDTSDMLVLGDKLNNPYSVKNISSAFKSLYPDIDVNEYVKPTDIYMRFLPEDDTQMKMLEELGLELVDHPLDYEIVKEGDYSNDPDVSEDRITWQYSTVPLGVNLPEGIKKEWLDVCVLNLESGLKTFIIGMGAKMLLANPMGTLWAGMSRYGYETLSCPYAWLGAFGYSFQLYFDFAGYSLMAMGLGQMLGLYVPKNFDHPYISGSMAEFWRRWHMTLGRWFKKYLYFPLGGSRCSFAKTIRNTFVVWAFTGLWHGASWNFVLWGLIFFVLLTIERLGLGKLLAKTKVLKHIYVIFLIPLTWVVFALPNMQDIATYFSRLFPFFADNTASFVNTKDVIRALHDYWYLLIACVVFCLPFPSRWYEKHKNSKLVILGLVLIYLMSVYKMQTQTSNPFLYYQF